MRLTMIGLTLILTVCVTQAADIRPQHQLVARPSVDSSTISTNARICASESMDIARQGRQLYHGKAVCLGCHGANGDPATVTNPDVAKLNPPPTDLRNAAVLKHPSDSQRFNLIRNGIPGTGMVPFRGHLTPGEISLLIEYLEVLKDGGC